MTFSPAIGRRPRTAQSRTALTPRQNTATHRPASLGWGPVGDLGADIIAGIRSVKAKAGPDLIVWGSSTLTSVLLEQGLVDEVLLLVYPVLLGQGKRLLANSADPRELALVNTKAKGPARRRKHPTARGVARMTTGRVKGACRRILDRPHRRRNHLFAMPLLSFRFFAVSVLLSALSVGRAEKPAATDLLVHVGPTIEITHSHRYCWFPTVHQFPSGKIMVTMRMSPDES